MGGATDSGSTTNNHYHSYVIDSGLVKARAFNSKTGIDSLVVVPISKAAARQRAGRAGREAPGKCYRLYTEEGYRSLRESTVPEIKRYAHAFLCE